jgi:tartrate dehydrogenase/decarboxylase/D-malate dehydrogenase
MLMRHLGEEQAASAIERAIETVLAEGGPRTPDIGGQAKTGDLGKAVADAVGA